MRGGMSQEGTTTCRKMERRVNKRDLLCMKNASQHICLTDPYAWSLQSILFFYFFFLKCGLSLFCRNVSEFKCRQLKKAECAREIWVQEGQQACVYVYIERFKHQQLEKRLRVTGLSNLSVSKQSGGHATEVWQVSNCGRTISLRAGRSRCQQLQKLRMCASTCKSQLEKKPWVIGLQVFVSAAGGTHVVWMPDV